MLAFGVEDLFPGGFSPKPFPGHEGENMGQP